MKPKGFKIDITPSQACEFATIWQMHGEDGGVIICQPHWEHETNGEVVGSLNCAVVDPETAAQIYEIVIGKKQEEEL